MWVGDGSAGVGQGPQTAPPPPPRGGSLSNGLGTRLKTEGSTPPAMGEARHRE